MLSKLVIENYALIDRLEIEFSGGFSVITGETGAGKSILLGALSLILGNRADASVLLDKDRKCIVEGTFIIKGYHLEAIFKAYELDYEESAIFRREILPSGKSRAFINDTPVNLSAMKELGDRLVNVHSQFSVITLNDADFQLAVLDDYSANAAIISSYRDNFSKYSLMKKELAEYVRKEAAARKDRDYNQFLFEEIEGAKLSEGEQEEAEQRLDILAHAGEIKSGLLQATEILSSGESNVTDKLSSIANLTMNLSRFHPALKEISERIKSSLIELRDISAGMDDLGDEIEFDQAEITKLSDRLDQIYHLEKKHGVSTIKELLDARDRINNQLLEATSMEDRISEMGKMIVITEENLISQAGLLRDNRNKVIPDLEEKIKKTLVKVGMPDARISIDIRPLEEMSSDGIDSVRFLFSANKGIALNEISRIASGGELSRLMLSIKSLISRKNLLPTIIFDEIDVGVSGEIAGKVGDILCNMGKTMQVIAITHLPQIAGKGSSHYRVYKLSNKESARTRLQKLEHDDRVLEIARMLSNEKVSDAAMETAKELMGN